MTNTAEHDVSPYALFLRLEGRKVLVVGGGPVALAKAREVAQHGARVVVVSPVASAELVELAVAHEARGFDASDLDDAWLVVAAAPPEVNRTVKAAADARRIFCVAVDDVASCSAFGAARLVRGGITVAISSGGKAPALVALLRRALEAVLPEDVGAWRSLAEDARAGWKNEGIPIEERRARLLRAMVEREETSP